MSLVALPNGDWLDAWVVTGVRARPDKNNRNAGVVAIEQLSGFTVFCSLKTYGEACVAAEDFAKAVNTARDAFPVENDKALTEAS